MCRALSKRHGEGGGRAQLGHGGNIDHAVDLEPVPVDVHQLEHFAHHRMLDLVEAGGALQLGIGDHHVVVEALVQGDIDVFVDGRRDQEAFVFAEIGGVVGAAAAQRNTKRAPHNDHRLLRNWLCAAARAG